MQSNYVFFLVQSILTCGNYKPWSVKKILFLMGKYQIWPSKSSYLCALDSSVRPPWKKLLVSSSASHMDGKHFSGDEIWKQLSPCPIKIKMCTLLWKEHRSASGRSRLVAVVFILICIWLCSLFYECAIICLSRGGCFCGVRRLVCSWVKCDWREAGSWFLLLLRPFAS